MRVMVIGGSKGIGKAIADYCQERDHTVFRMARSYKGSWEYHRECFVDLDGDEGDIRQQVDLALEALGGLDWLVVSAGRSAYLAPWEETHEESMKMLRVNFLGRLSAYRALRKTLIKSKGSVLFLSSSVAEHGAKGLGLYSASLGALESWARCEHLSMHRSGLRINVLSPGWVNSEMTADLRSDYREAAERWMPIGRFLEPEEVAQKAVEILQSGESGRVVSYLGV